MTVMLTGVFVCHSSVCNKLYAKEQHWLERSAPKWSQFTISEASDMFQQGVNPAVGWYVAAPDHLSPWAANRGCRSDLQRRGWQRSWLQHSRVGWAESLAHSLHID